MSSESADSDDVFGSIMERVSGSTKVKQNGEDFMVEQTLQPDEEVSTPISNTVNDTREKIQEDKHDTIFDLYDSLVNLDGELSGAVNAISQSASYSRVTLPEDEPSDIEEEILRECQNLAKRLRGKQMSIDILRNLIKYGNDMNKKVYNEDDGIVAVQSLPIKSMTIADDRTNLHSKEEGSDGDFDNVLFQAHPSLDSDREELVETGIEEAFERDVYVLNEELPDDRSLIEPHNVLHFSIDARSNWFEDRVGRETYGIWGQSRLEALKFTIQTKYNTLLNKVAMDDNLLAREVYYIDTKELFGDIKDRKERRKKAESYAEDLSQMLEDLDADERPMLPDHVDVEVIGPEGKAIDQKPFIEQLNNGIAAALTFPMAGLGRGTTSVKAGEEISSLWAENNIQNLRESVVMGFEEIFRDHIKILYPDQVVNHSEASQVGEMRLDPDITIPTLEYEPFKEEDRTQKADQIETLRKVGVMSIPEAREEWGLPTDEESVERAREDYLRLKEPALRATSSDSDVPETNAESGNQPDDNESEELIPDEDENETEGEESDVDEEST